MNWTPYDPSWDRDTAALAGRCADLFHKGIPTSYRDLCAWVDRRHEWVSRRLEWFGLELPDLAKGESRRTRRTLLATDERWENSPRYRPSMNRAQTEHEPRYRPSMKSVAHQAIEVPNRNIDRAQAEHESSMNRDIDRALPLLEKKEEININKNNNTPRPGARPRTRKKQIPDGWQPKDTTRTWLTAKGLPADQIDAFVEQFVIANQMEGKIRANWDRACQNWLLMDQKFAAQRGSTKAKKERSSEPTAQTRAHVVAGIQTLIESSTFDEHRINPESRPRLMNCPLEWDGNRLKWFVPSQPAMHCMKRLALDDLAKKHGVRIDIAVRLEA